MTNFDKFKQEVTANFLVSLMSITQCRNCLYISQGVYCPHGKRDNTRKNGNAYLCEPSCHRKMHEWLNAPADSETHFTHALRYNLQESRYTLTDFDQRNLMLAQIREIVKSL